MRYKIFLLRRGTLILKVLILTVICFMVALLTTLPSPNENDDKEAKPLKMAKPTNTKKNSRTYDNNLSDGLVIAALGLDNAPGELGKPVVLPKNITEETEQVVSEGWKKNAFNQYVSDLISIRRKLPDPRDEWCKVPGRYLEDLPQTSVVICFHNEAWSTLLRTVHSVLDRSPSHLLKEIILVDDYSDMPHLMQQLDDYLSSLSKVRIVRASRREGLIRARLLGVRYVTAPVLTYLDSHCECTEGWLEPLLDRIARSKTTVVCPVIDIINENTFEYHHTDLSSINVGGFNWNLEFDWHTVPSQERARHQHIAEPVWSPTMAGGLFAIDKDFFERLGTYDSGFDIWGGENLELSFKTWMCGGTLEIVPCSHVGHVFRKRSPYTWRTDVDVLKKNSVRVAEVWLDDYAKYYYQRAGPDKGDYGDVSGRKELRQKLGCKSFEWYLKNIYPELFIPGESVAYGEIRNNLNNQSYCLDGATISDNESDELKQPRVNIYPCHNTGGDQMESDRKSYVKNMHRLGSESQRHEEAYQRLVMLQKIRKSGLSKTGILFKAQALWADNTWYWMYSKYGEIRRDETCLDYSGNDVFLYLCHGQGGNQLWLYNDRTKLLKHNQTKKCIAISRNEDKIVMETCNESEGRQMWNLENFRPDRLNLIRVEPR